MGHPRPVATIVLDPAHPSRDPANPELGPDELRRLVRSGALARHLLGYPAARLLVESLDGVLSPKGLLAARLLSAGPVWVEDRQDRRMPLDLGASIRIFGGFLRDGAAAPKLVRRARQAVAALEAAAATPRARPPLDPETGVLFLRTDLWRGVVAGGSVAHIAGVANELCRQLGSVDFLSTDAVPILSPAINTTLVAPERRWWSTSDLHQLHLNATIAGAIARAKFAKPGRLVYQRYSVYNWNGLEAARRNGLPFVLEFNGPEVWVADHWGRPLAYPDLADRIEQLNVSAADLVTVVSESLREHLLGRGVPEERIFVNPNGVDPAIYSPDIDGMPVRQRLGLGSACTVGFIGTFGPWHGVELLAEGFARLLNRRADLRDQLRLLLIGDGQRRPAVETILREHGRAKETIFAGLVPQAEGPAYLAACDILVIPTVPNRDGSAFFGSPTKLFEYMAMGRGIIASAVGQVATILEHGRTAWLVPAGDPAAMEDGIERLVKDVDLRRRLGKAARAEVIARYTWARHAARLVERLKADDLPSFKV